MTKLTREQHLAMAQCLREAKKKLNRNETDHRNDTGETYVCFAVNRTDFAPSIEFLVHKWIEQQLGDYAYITRWAARKNSNIDFSTYEQRQEYRHAWVDHMIKVLES
jgi:hypothetical protein